MKRADYILIAALFAVIMGAILWLYASSESAAAWVQAIGALVAIGWGIWLWQRDRIKARTDAREKATIVAFRLAPYFFDIQLTLELAQSTIKVAIDRLGADPTDAILLAMKETQTFPRFPSPSLYEEFRYLSPRLAQLITHVVYAIERGDRTFASGLALLNKYPKELHKILQARKNGLEKLDQEFRKMQQLFAAEFASRFSTNFETKP
jgi:hypothetical protein